MLAVPGEEMKIFTKMAAVVLACMLAVPGEARVNVVYQRQDSLRIVGLLQQARAMKKKPASWMLWFGKQMAGWLACWLFREKR